MKTLAKSTVGSILTVHKVTGGKNQINKMETIGIMSGSDITLLDISQSKDIFYISVDSKELTISAEDAATVRVVKQFVRKKGDPIFLGGCCAYGNTADLWERINTMNQEEENGDNEL